MRRYQVYAGNGSSMILTLLSEYIKKTAWSACRCRRLRLPRQVEGELTVDYPSDSKPDSCKVMVIGRTDFAPKPKALTFAFS